MKVFKPLLSIYSPVFNHGKIIEQNLQFIAQEIRKIESVDDIEIVISDNASTDDTGQKVIKFKDENPDLNLVYSRNSQNIGGNKNIMNLWEKTRGDYVIMIGDDCFAKGGLVNLYSSIKENFGADIIVLKNNTYTDFEYNQNATTLDVMRHVEKLQYIGNFVLRRQHFAFDFDKFPFSGNSYLHLIMIMNRIADAKKVIDTRFVAININISWNFDKTIKIIFKLQLDCLEIAEMFKSKIDKESYKLLLKIFYKSLYNALRFIRGYKQRWQMFRYILNGMPKKNPKICIALVLHCLPAPFFYLLKIIDAVCKYSKYCFQEMRRNRIRWKDKEFSESQDHIEDNFNIL